MFLYENNTCPVCNKAFEQGDDVVVCPECGTPHHRECYNSTGKCANKNLHGTDFVFERSSYKEIRVKKENTFDDVFANADAMSSNSREYKPQHIANSEAAANKNTTDNESTQTSQQINNLLSAGAEMLDREIDGVKTADVITVVGVNYPRYLKKFSKNRKIGWNWSAFFFGPYYFMFRKMYLESLIFITLPMLVSVIVNYLFQPAVKILNDIITQANSFVISNEFEKASEYIKEALYLPENRQGLYIIFGVSAISLLIRIVSALIADSLYRKKVVKIVKTVDEKVNMGESFSLIGSGALFPGEEMSQQDMRKMFLAKQGGVNTFLPFLLIMLAFFTLMF